MRTIQLLLGDTTVVVSVAGVEWLIQELGRHEDSAALVARLREVQAPGAAAALSDIRIGAIDKKLLRRVLARVNEAALPPEMLALRAFMYD